MNRLPLALFDTGDCELAFGVQRLDSPEAAFNARDDVSVQVTFRVREAVVREVRIAPDCD